MDFVTNSQEADILIADAGGLFHVRQHDFANFLAFS